MIYALITNGLARLLRTPQYLILFVSDKCWMKCRHCWYNEKWKDVHLQKNSVMTFEQMQKLAQSIKRLPFLSFAGGEAFLRNDIADLTEMFIKTADVRRFQIPTAGYDTNLVVSRTEQILKSNAKIPFRVDVSLDGTEDTHDFIRGVKGGYTGAVNTIKALNALKKHYSSLDVGVMSTVSVYNQDEIDELSGIVENIHPRGEWMVKILRGEPRDPKSSGVAVEKYFHVHRLIEERIKKGEYSGHKGHLAASWLSAKNAVRRKVIRKIALDQYQSAGCSAGTLIGVISCDGQARACEMLDLDLGNIEDFDYDLFRLWNSPEAKKIRTWIQNTKCSCTHECFLSTSLLLRPQHWWDIIVERMKLARSEIKLHKPDR